MLNVHIKPRLLLVITLLSVGILLSTNPLALAVPQEPDGWVSGATSVSGLSLAEQARLCGIPLDVLEWEASQEADPPQVSQYTYPPALDWRNHGGDWTTPIRNQGSCGSCTAFATVAAIESRLKISYYGPEFNPDLSEAHLFYCGCGRCCETGTWPDELMDFARDTGIADEACYRYIGANQDCKPCDDWATRATRISEWHGLNNPADIKQSLADHGPVETTMIVSNDFFWYVSGVYRQGGWPIGGHAVTIVGYNDPGGYWIVKNSWGTGWGEDGWFRIAYGECGIDDYAYEPVLPPPCPGCEPRLWFPLVFKRH